ncbi:trimethylamine methyltransferase family protein [Solirhodobacter olei]|uniref:trimethylamine methyltransferase family protein n=1 Tax=Solirhodobacter olei TaxID=2493082 RepID=UPI000FDB49A2|nr:trimethylamine methyltransferase family protein [Solirhodobacter olei]
MDQARRGEHARQGGRRRHASGPRPSARVVDYRHLRHPFAPQRVFSDDAVAALHEAALGLLEDLGIKFLLPEARALFRAAGATVDEDSQMVRIGREIVTAALATAPRSIPLAAPDPAFSQTYEDGTLLFMGGAGCPNVTDLARGRRPGTLDDYQELIKLQSSFDVIHKMGAGVEAQDIPVPQRHLAVQSAQLRLGRKIMSTGSRGRRAVQDCFDMIRLGLNLDEAAFRAASWTVTVINTNSPRQVDTNMAEGIIDFARAGQMSIITPFCLAGAMAPVTLAGALVLQHAEALAGITLSQLAAPGAPVSYGGFSSNVDMRSGAPAFGTPEHVKMQIGSGQLARHIGLPWRSASGASSNVADMQGAMETMMSLWGALMANATITIHAAGWQEGGLSFGYEKFINDVEALQRLAELCTPVEDDPAALAADALAEVAPGGHFFGAALTMERYDRAFYEPLVADLSNFGSWSDAGAQTSTERATGIWQRVLADYHQPDHGAEAEERIAAFVERRRAEVAARPE